MNSSIENEQLYWERSDPIKEEIDFLKSSCFTEIPLEILQDARTFEDKEIECRFSWGRLCNVNVFF